MATGFSFKVQGLDKLIKVFNDLPAQTQKELAAELDFTAGEIRDGAKRDAPTDEARLKQSISKAKTGPLEFEAVAQTFYAGYLEFGTKGNTRIPAGLEDVANSLKGPASGQGNPIDALQAWVKRKGIAGTFSTKIRRRQGNKATKEQQDRQAAYMIWQKIKKFGIKPHPFFFKQLAPAEERLRRRLAAIIKDLIS
jgi:HK97 gp10 family phage protein